MDPKTFVKRIKFIMTNKKLTFLNSAEKSLYKY